MRVLIATALIMFFCISLISAEGNDVGVKIVIKNNTINVQGFADIFGTPTRADIFEEVNESLSSDILICEDLTIPDGNTTRTIKTNCSVSIDYQKYIAISSSNITTEGSLVDKYFDCVDDLRICNNERSDLEAYKKNYNDNLEAVKERDSCQANLTTCTTSLSTCRTEKSQAETAKSTCETEQENKSNSHWLWAIGGFVLGALGIAYKEGLWFFSPKTKLPEDSYNPQQSA